MGGDGDNKGPTILETEKNGVKTFMMNRPLQLNPWTFQMQGRMFELFHRAATDEATKGKCVLSLLSYLPPDKHH